MQQTITIRLKLKTKAEDEALFFSTMTAYREACNYVSAYIFNTHDLKQGSLSKVLYYQLREKFALRSQMAQSVIKTVIARYKTVLTNQKDWIKPVFKKLQYELVWNRDYSLTNNCFSVNTLEGRLRLSYCNNINSARQSLFAVIISIICIFLSAMMSKSALQMMSVI